MASRTAVGRRANAVAVVLLALALPAAIRGDQTLDGPNVLLISIDSLRADHLSCYGYPRLTSPNIDTLAREGTLFEDARSASSWTIPSHMTMLTALRPEVHGVDRLGRRLAPDQPTLASRLRDAGYRTAAFVTGPTLHRDFGFGQGFDEYVNTMEFGPSDFGERGGPVMSLDVMERSHHIKGVAAVSELAQQWITHQQHSPFFLFLHLWDAHYDYTPPPPYDTKFDGDYHGAFDFTDLEHNAAINASMPEAEKARLVALYDGEIAAIDAAVGRIMDTLERAGMLEHTLVVLTSDHGEEFFEHGGKGHVLTLYDEVTHVPLIFRYPAKVPSGRRVAGVFGAAHLMPTILGFVGIDLDGDEEERDESDVVAGAAPPDHGWAFSEVSFQRKDPLYLISTDKEELLGGPPAGNLVVYDSHADPREMHPRPPNDDETRYFVERVEEAVGHSPWQVAAASHTTAEPVHVNEQTQQALRALGYVN